MNKKIKFAVALLAAVFACQGLFADKIDDFLKDYEVFVTRVEKQSKNKEYDAIDSIKKENDEFMSRRDTLGELGDWTFNQTKKYTKLKTKYTTAISTLKSSKGLEKFGNDMKNFGDSVEDGAKKFGNSVEKGFEDFKKNLEEEDSESQIDENMKA